MTSWMELVAIAFVFTSAIMLVTWWLAKKINNYGIVDAVWGLSFLAVALLYSLLGVGSLPRDLLMINVVGAWSLRLGIFLTRRIASHHPHEDTRYVTLRREYGEHVERGFFWFFQYQAWSVVLLSAPFLMMALNPAKELKLVEFIGAALAIFSLLGEALADAQSNHFKKNPANRGLTCRAGLWKYSRHPNYFFESLIWWGYFLMSLGSPGGWFSIYCPLLILFLLLKVTGVPMSEKHSLQSKGDDYRDYQKKTSVFIPWFPKALALFLFLGWGSVSQSSPQTVPKDRTARIYEIGKMDQPPLYLQKTHYQLDSKGELETHTVISTADGKAAIVEDAVSIGPKLISQVVNQHQTRNRYAIRMDKERAVFTRDPTEGAQDTKHRESSEDLRVAFVTGPVSEAFLHEHWSELVNGKTVKCDFGVLELRESVGFQFDYEGEVLWKGKKVAIVKMKPSHFLTGMMVTPLFLYLDLVNQRFIGFKGRTPLLADPSANAKSDRMLDAEIGYD